MEKLEELSCNDYININGGEGVQYGVYYIAGWIAGKYEKGIRSRDFSHVMARRAL
jgi:hypothetical protein